MLKRNIADELYSKVLKRYRNERPEIEITTQLMDSIWFNIYKILNADGEDKAKEFVESDKIFFGAGAKVVLEVNCWEVEKYEVTLIDKSVHTFESEETALKFCEENYYRLLCFKRIEHAIVCKR